MKEMSMLIPENFAVDEAAEFRERLIQLIDNGQSHFSLDFRNCSFIDSTGLGVLVSIYKRCMEIGGTFKIHSINNQQVIRIFRLTRLDKVFNI